MAASRGARGLQLLQSGAALTCETQTFRKPCRFVLLAAGSRATAATDGRAASHGWGCCVRSWPHPLLAVLGTSGWLRCSVGLGKRQAPKKPCQLLLFHYFPPPPRVPLPPCRFFLPWFETASSQLFLELLEKSLKIPRITYLSGCLGHRSLLKAILWAGQGWRG